MILTPLQKLPNNVGDLDTIIVAASFEWCPKFKKSPILVTLVTEKWSEKSIFIRVRGLAHLNLSHWYGKISSGQDIPNDQKYT